MPLVRKGLKREGGWKSGKEGVGEKSNQRGDDAAFKDGRSADSGRREGGANCGEVGWVKTGTVWVGNKSGIIIVGAVRNCHKLAANNGSGSRNNEEALSSIFDDGDTSF